jgi:UDP-glucose 4-epimerase
MTDETVLITGAAGYIGSRVSKRVIEEGYNTILVDNFHKNKVKTIEGEKVHNADIRNRYSMRKVVNEEVDYVIHLAALTGVEECEENPKAAKDVNARGTAKVATLCIQEKTPMIFPASMAIFGNIDEFPVTPETPRKPVNKYGWTKRTGEQVMNTYAEDNFPGHVFINSNVYGTHRINGREISKGTVVNYFVDKAVKRETLTVHSPGVQERDFIHVKDVAEAYLSSLENISSHENGSEPYLIASGESRSIVEVARLVSQKMQKLTGEKVELKEVENPRENPVQYTGLEIDTSKTEEELGFEPEGTFEKQIERMLKKRLEKDNS